MSITRILYRGSLSSCNYACGYCPFAKTRNTREELQRDRNQLNRFVGWAASSSRPIGVFITPWGEAIIHRYYREAMIQLSWMEHVQRVAVQTNLSCRLDDLRKARADRLAVWATFHPDETDLPRFLERCASLQSMKIRFSVGVVGFKEYFGAISELRLAYQQTSTFGLMCLRAAESFILMLNSIFLTQLTPTFVGTPNVGLARGNPVTRD